MLYKLGHGQTIAAAGNTGDAARGAGTGAADYVDLSDVASLGSARELKGDDTYPVPDPDPAPEPGLAPRQVFRFFCKDADDVAVIDDAADKLRALADAMAEADFDQADEGGESNIPPVFTYFGQFIDHDITANTDREETAGTPEAAFNIDRPDFSPQSRDAAEEVKLNLRKGRLELDSVYGDGPGQSPAALKLEAALRDPDDPAKMRLGKVSPVPGFERPPLPADDGADLPRVGQAVDSGHLSMDEVNQLFNADGSKSEEDLRRLALIGDGRNDENLIVAQFHLSFLRLHNALVDKIRDANGAADDDAVFVEARENVTHIYQWLVVNAFLRAVCDTDVVDQVLADRAPLYAQFYDVHKDDVPEGVRPMPIEFSVAAFRYGHSMVRGEYDWNRNFGRDADGDGDGRATFQQMFQFTGEGGMAGLPSLPDNWIAEWDRMVGTAPMENRVARSIDTRLALALKSMRNAPEGLMAHLAERNLRRGYVFNVPDAQAMISCLRDRGISIEALSADRIADGSDAMRSAVTGGGFDRATPLWFYLLKEAEIAGGNHMGPLGSRLVAETLIGLLATDPRSYLNQGDFGSWTPADAVQPAGEPITDLAAMMRAGGLHA